MTRHDPKAAVDAPSTAADSLVGMYRGMVFLRVLDELCSAYQAQGRLWTYAPIRGHEAMQVGVHHAARTADWLVPTYREPTLRVLRGEPLTTMLAWYRGLPQGWTDPRGCRVAPVCIPVGSQVPHAAGLAMGLALRGESAGVVVLFGDGATSEGDFHEGANLAAVFAAPLVLVCNNNQWAISTPVERQTRVAHLADKAVGYGIPASRVDGGDPVAVADAVAAGLRRAHAGEGPTFVEAVTVRSGPHAATDDPSLYRSEDDLRAAEDTDPLPRAERALAARGLLDEAETERLRERFHARIVAAMADVEGLAADPAALFDTAYADPPEDLREQRSDALGGDRR